MKTLIRSCLSSGVAVIGLSGLVTASVIAPVAADHTAVALTAQVAPLPEPARVALASPLDLVGRQATFHAELVVDFLVTGAELAGRIPSVAGNLVHDIGDGTPLPTALRRAVLDFAAIEFDAGRELVGFARDWANFQIQFLRDLVSGLPTGPVGPLLTAALDVASQIVEGVVEFSNTVIVAAETVVGDVLGDVPGSSAPTPAVTATAAPSPPTPETRRSADVTATETAEPVSEDTVESEDNSDDAPAVEATPTTQPSTPRSIAELRDHITVEDEAGNEPADTTDAEAAMTEEVDAADTDQPDAEQSDAGQSDQDKPTRAGYSSSAQRRNNASPGG